jgi:hypothetical protein
MYIIGGGLNHPQNVDLNMERSDQSIFWIFVFRRLINLVGPAGIVVFYGRADPIWMYTLLEL